MNAMCAPHCQGTMHTKKSTRATHGLKMHEIETLVAACTHACPCAVQGSQGGASACTPIHQGRERWRAGGRVLSAVHATAPHLKVRRQVLTTCSWEGCRKQTSQPHNSPHHITETFLFSTQANGQPNASKSLPRSQPVAGPRPVAYGSGYKLVAQLTAEGLSVPSSIHTQLLPTNHAWPGASAGEPTFATSSARNLLPVLLLLGASERGANVRHTVSK